MQLSILANPADAVLVVAPFKVSRQHTLSQTPPQRFGIQSFSDRPRPAFSPKETSRLIPHERRLKSKNPPSPPTLPYFPLVYRYLRYLLLHRLPDFVLRTEMLLAVDLVARRQ